VKEHESRKERARENRRRKRNQPSKADPRGDAACDLVKKERKKSEKALILRK